MDNLHFVITLPKEFSIFSQKSQALFLKNLWIMKKIECSVIKKYFHFSQKLNFAGMNFAKRSYDIPRILAKFEKFRKCNSWFLKAFSELIFFICAIALGSPLYFFVGLSHGAVNHNKTVPNYQTSRFIQPFQAA